MTTEEKIKEVITASYDLYANIMENQLAHEIKIFLSSEIREAQIKILEEMKQKFEEKDLLGSYNLMLSEINKLREEGKEKV